MDRRLTTIVAADLVGYSRLMAADEEGTVDRFRSVRVDLIRPQLQSAHARLIKTMGDGLLVEFPSPVAAVRASLAIQRGMVELEKDRSEDEKLKFRIGINLGDVIIDDNDILGDAVNVAARLESLAPPGGICISRAVQEQLRGKTKARLTPLGPQNVKNLPEPVEVWRVEVDGVEAVSLASGPAVPPSLVVLPFDNMSSDPEQEFLADGIVEDVTTELSLFRTLTVIARNSAFTYKDTPKDVREIAQELGVRYVVEGSVRRAGDRLRVTAQLIEAETGGHLWADRWDRTMADLFDVQDELTSAIVTGVEPELGAHERTLSRRKPTENLTAWELAQKGYARFFRFTPQDCEAAFDLYQKSLQLDPDFAFVHALCARTFYAKIALGWSRDFQHDSQTGLRYAERCVELDAKSDYGHTIRGGLLAFAGQHKDAANAFDLAENLNHNSIVLCMARGVAEFSSWAPDPDVCENAALKALRLSPRDPQISIFHNMLGAARLVRNGWQYDEAVAEHFEAACREANASDALLLNAVFANAQLNRMDRAARYLERAIGKNQHLTEAALRGRWPHFPWVEKLLEVNEGIFEKLVDLGLPRK